jgi:hypothetical protein
MGTLVRANTAKYPELTTRFPKDKKHIENAEYSHYLLWKKVVPGPGYSKGYNKLYTNDKRVMA